MQNAKKPTSRESFRFVVKPLLVKVVRKLTNSGGVTSRRRLKPRCFAQERNCLSSRVFDCFVVSFERLRPFSSAKNASTAPAMLVGSSCFCLEGSAASSIRRALRSACSQLRVCADCRTLLPSALPSIHFGQRQRR